MKVWVKQVRKWFPSAFTLCAVFHRAVLLHFHARVFRHNDGHLSSKQEKQQKWAFKRPWKSTEMQGLEALGPLVTKRSQGGD